MGESPFLVLSISISIFTNQYLFHPAGSPNSSNSKPSKYLPRRLCKDLPSLGVHYSSFDLMSPISATSSELISSTANHSEIDIRFQFPHGRILLYRLLTYKQVHLPVPSIDLYLNRMHPRPNQGFRLGQSL